MLWSVLTDDMTSDFLKVEFHNLYALPEPYVQSYQCKC